MCPKGKGHPSYEVADAARLYKYQRYAPGGSKVSFVMEYASSFLTTAWQVLTAYLSVYQRIARSATDGPAPGELAKTGKG